MTAHSAVRESALGHSRGHCERPSLPCCWQLAEQRPVRHVTAHSCRAGLHVGLRGAQHEPGAVSAPVLVEWQARACLECLSEASQAAVLAACALHPSFRDHQDGNTLCATAAVCHRVLVWLLQVFFIFAVITNLLVSTSMLQGCVAVVNALTGINIYGEHRSILSSRTFEELGPASSP